MKECTSRKSLRIREMSEGDRPQEKMIKYGAKALSDTELIALILRTGTQSMNVVEVARQLLRQHGQSSILCIRVSRHNWTRKSRVSARPRP
ncbi:UPF0758 domain-containing protein [Porphyromonas cangingivalis]|uniref:UPF0758 domain-containing protein n=1 Tax=Porphyromonas cangingivalis TaxID=36874 RepID=UPI0011DDEEBE|nr:UPF0758 domain-containing protein [Porphyromonas cangingivalis]